MAINLTPIYQKEVIWYLPDNPRHELYDILQEDSFLGLYDNTIYNVVQ